MIEAYGDYFGCSGYSSHIRQLCRAINKIHPVKINVQVPPEAAKNLGDDELEMIKRTGQGEISLIVTMPMFWRLYADNKRNFAFLVFEGDKIPKSWAMECMNERIEYIFTPSLHTREAILTTLKEIVNKDKISYYEQKILIMPHGVDTKLFYPKPK